MTPTSSGVIETAEDGRRISAFREKPSDPRGLPDAPDQVFASMGNYVFRADTLIEAVSLDAEDEDSKHDLGSGIIPMMVEQGEAEVYDFADNDVQRSPTVTVATGGTSAPSTPTTTPTWT